MVKDVEKRKVEDSGVEKGDETEQLPLYSTWQETGQAEVGSRLRVVAAKAIAKAGAVWLGPAMGCRCLSTTVTGVSWNLAKRLLGHLWLLPASSSLYWT